MSQTQNILQTQNITFDQIQAHILNIALCDRPIAFSLLLDKLPDCLNVKFLKNFHFAGYINMHQPKSVVPLSNLDQVLLGEFLNSLTKQTDIAYALQCLMDIPLTKIYYSSAPSTDDNTYAMYQAEAMISRIIISNMLPVGELLPVDFIRFSRGRTITIKIDDLLAQYQLISI